jgi:uncharacterized repeat protein (TIGR02543 family)
MPASPIRDGYTFRYWGTPEGTQFTPDMPLSGDITLYAFWQVVPGTPGPTPTPPPNVIVNNPPAVGGGTTYVTVEPSTEQDAVTLPETQTPTSQPPTTITETEPPLASPTSTSGWSIFNLLAGILSLLMLLFYVIKFFFDRSRSEEYEEEPVDAQLWAAMSPEQRAQYQARRESDYQAWLADQQKNANRQKVLFINAPVLLIAIAAFIEAMIILFTTQTFTLDWTLVDDYSVIFALILFVELLTPMVAAIIRNGRKDPQQPQAAGQAPSGGGDMTL